MYCPRCGAENGNNSMFCRECGMKLSSPKKAKAVPVPKKKKIPKYVIAVIAVLGVLILGITVFINLGRL